MKRLLSITIFLAASLVPAFAALSPEEREFDFRFMVSGYAKYYAPYEWKRDYVGFDALKLEPWLTRIRAAKDDVEFYQICQEYVASLQDSHSSFSIPSNYSATTGIHADYYDGKVLIDNIVRGTLPVAQYPFQNGWEVVSVDGVPVEQFITDVAKLMSGATERERRRLAAARIGSRPQTILPRAYTIGDSLSLVLRDLNGTESTFTIPWIKRFQPLVDTGVIPYPVFGPTLPTVLPASSRSAMARRAADQEDEDSIVPAYLAPLRQYQNLSIGTEWDGFVLNVNSVNPIYALPTGFQARQSTYFTTGTFTANGLRIGLIRIPTFAPSSTTAALAQFQNEIAFFQQNTDGLVVDVMRNGGGNGCYCNELLRRVIPYQFDGVGNEIRATAGLVASFSQSLEAAKAAQAESWQIALWQQHLDTIMQAYKEQRGRTGPLPVCGPTVTYLPPAISYTKPVMLMADDFSASAADVFAAVFQDAKRGPVFGHTTNGAGGAVNDFPFIVYSESVPRVTITLLTRTGAAPVNGPFPASNYIENVGVKPDIAYDFQNTENLLSGRRLFTDKFVEAITNHIRANQ